MIMGYHCSLKDLIAFDRLAEEIPQASVVEVATCACTRVTTSIKYFPVSINELRVNTHSQL